MKVVFSRLGSIDGSLQNYGFMGYPWSDIIIR